MTKVDMSERQHFMQYIQRLETRISDLSRSLDVAKCEHDDLADRLHQLECHRLSTKEHQKKYLDSIRQRCIELQCRGWACNQMCPTKHCSNGCRPTSCSIYFNKYASWGLLVSNLVRYSLRKKIWLYIVMELLSMVCMLDFRCQLNQVLIRWGCRKWSLGLNTCHIPELKLIQETIAGLHFLIILWLFIGPACSYFFGHLFTFYGYI